MNWTILPRRLTGRAPYELKEEIVGNLATALAVVLTAATLNPPDQEIVAFDRVDLVEVNHFYDEHGKLVFDQVIFYDWCDQQCRYNVRAWRLLKKPAQVPQRNFEHGDYVAIWQDGTHVRKVRASSYRESWTQYDPELVEREHLPKDKRADLCKLIIKGSSQR